jgi:hypothetical protein
MATTKRWRFEFNSRGVFPRTVCRAKLGPSVNVAALCGVPIGFF